MTGIKGGSVYHHFDSKQEILFLIMDSTLSGLTDLVQTAILSKKRPLEKLYEAISAHIQYHVDNLDDTYVADTEIRSLTEENYKKIIAKRKHYENLFKKILTDITKNGKIEINPKLATLAILQMCTGLSLWFRRGGDMSIQDITDQYYNLILNGITDSSK